MRIASQRTTSTAFEHARERLPRGSFLAPHPVEDGEDLVDRSLPRLRPAGSHDLRHTRPEMAPQQDQRHLVERPAYRRQLCEQVETVALLLDHPLQGLDLAGRAPQPGPDLVLLPS